MSYIKQITNASLAPITLDFYGLTLAPSETIRLNEVEWNDFRVEDALAEIGPFILSGDLVVNDGTVNLSPKAGLRLIARLDKIDIQTESGVGKVLDKIDIQGCFVKTTFDDDQGTATLDFNEHRMVGATYIDGTTIPKAMCYLTSPEIVYLGSETL